MKTFLLLCSVCCLMSGALGQDWTGPYLLSGGFGGIKPATCKEWLRGNATCMVWQYFNGGEWTVLSKFCSFQNGSGWGPALPVNGPGEAVNPAVACYNNWRPGARFWCVWEHRDTWHGDICAAVDTFGIPWGPQAAIGTSINADGDSAWPGVIVIGHDPADTAWVTWTCRDTDGWRIEYVCNAGDSWTTPMIAVSGTDPIRRARLGRGYHGRSDGCPLLTWESNGDIFYTEYLDGSWQVPQEVAHSAALDRNPEVVSYTNYPFPLGPYITWESTRDGDTAVYGTAADTFSIGRRWCDSTGAGNNYAPCGTPAAYTTDYWAPVAAAWVSDREGNANIYSRTLFSEDDVRVDGDPATDVNPTLTTMGVTMHWCIWQSDRSGNWDIWGSYVYATGVEESGKPQVARFKLQATVLHRLPDGARAFDATGRRALNPNSGTYFVTDDGTRFTVHARKVVIQH